MRVQIEVMVSFLGEVGCVAIYSKIIEMPFAPTKEVTLFIHERVNEDSEFEIDILSYDHPSQMLTVTCFDNDAFPDYEDRYREAGFERQDG